MERSLDAQRKVRTAMTSSAPLPQPTRSELDALSGPALVGFGTGWCGFCRAAQPLIARALASHPRVRHVRIEDGRGRRLGRSFGVKLWPTLIFLKDGQELSRLVRPDGAEAIASALDRIDPG
jgi:thioredoxin 1